MTDNPYASPVMDGNAVAHATTNPGELRVASQGKRFLNMIIDSIVTQVLSAAAGVVIGIVYAATKMAGGENVGDDSQIMLQVVGYIVGLSVAVAYYGLMEGLFQVTLGKLLTGTRVVTASGGRPSFGQILGRSFARFIPFEAFSFLGGKEPVGWHDSLSGTRVVLK